MKIECSHHWVIEEIASICIYHFVVFPWLLRCSSRKLTRDVCPSAVLCRGVYTCSVQASPFDNADPNHQPTLKERQALRQGRQIENQIRKEEGDGTALSVCAVHVINPRHLVMLS